MQANYVLTLMECPEDPIFLDLRELTNDSIAAAYNALSDDPTWPRVTIELDALPIHLPHGARTVVVRRLEDGEEVEAFDAYIVPLETVSECPEADEEIIAAMEVQS